MKVATVTCFLSTLTFSHTWITSCNNYDIIPDNNDDIISESVAPNGISYDDYDFPVTEAPPSAKPLQRTIICDHLLSMGSLSLYSYQEQNFEQHLKIQNSDIPTLPQSAFLKFTTITKLYLRNLHIQTILPGAFNGLQVLKELDLSNNNLTEISKGIFNPLYRLEILKLNHNNIHHIENLTFTGTDSLVHLHLQYNEIESIEEGVLKTQKHLRYLDVSQNPLVEFDLNGALNLDILNMSGTLLDTFGNNKFDSPMHEINLKSSRLSKIDFSLFPKLELADLSNNSIEIVQNCDVIDILDLILDYNKIEVINCSFGQISHLSISHNRLTTVENGIFNKSHMLFSADLSFNNVSILKKYVFKDLTLLRRLSLQHNHISRIDPVLFKDLQSLVSLNLSHNNILEFQYGTFDSLSSLEVLDISNNHLLELHQYSFNSLSNLHTLFFDNNNISFLNVEDMKTHLLQLHLVSLDNNPWECKNLFKIHQSFKSVRVSVRRGHSFDVENFQGVACNNAKDFTIQSSIQSNSSKFEKFFNGDFQKSKFFQYFDRDYIRSNFFKYLGNYRLAPIKYENSTKLQVERLTALQEQPSGSDNRILIFSVVIQVLIVLVLVCGFYFMVSFLKKIGHSGLKQYSEMELTQNMLCNEP